MIHDLTDIDFALPAEAIVDEVDIGLIVVNTVLIRTGDDFELFNEFADEVCSLQSIASYIANLVWTFAIGYEGDCTEYVLLSKAISVWDSNDDVEFPWLAYPFTRR